MIAWMQGSSTSYGVPYGSYGVPSILAMIINLLMSVPVVLDTGETLLLVFLWCALWFLWCAQHLGNDYKSAYECASSSGHR